MTVKHWAGGKAVDAAYPTCHMCGANMRRPCTIACEIKGEPKGFVACPRCYGVWVCLQQMMVEGIIWKEE
jgi:hypothetical protein